MLCLHRGVLLRCSKVLVMMVALSLLLTACGSVDTEVTFYEGERWHTVMRLTVSREIVEMAGGEEALERQALSDLDEEVEGVEVSWVKERSDQQGVVYRITLDGTGWERLNRAVFDNRARITREGDRVHIRYEVPWGSELTITTLTLRGGKIISSNADEVSGGSATWHYPSGTVEAVLTEKSHVSVALVVVGGLCALLIAGLVVAAGGIGIFVLSRRTTKIYCTKCGAANAAGNQFCIKCGEKL